MKKIFKILSILFFLANAAIAYAHPPQDIIINYDPVKKVLKAVIIHNVSDPAKHYIKKVDVAINGKEVIEHRISRQDNFDNQTVSYVMPDAAWGDVLSVEAYCSMSGVLKKEIKLGR